MEHATITFDGGKRPNRPGYGSYRIELSFGASISAQRLKLATAKTSNESEYLILLCALHRLIEHCEIQNIPASSVRLTVLGDSQLVVRQINGEYRCTKDSMFRLCSKACELLNHFHADSRILWHDRSHSVTAFGH